MKNALVFSAFVLTGFGAGQSVVPISVWPDGSALPLVGVYQPLIDPNGRFVVFVGQDVWVKQLDTGVAERVATLRSLPLRASLSADGRHLILAFAEDRPQLYLLQLGSGALQSVQSPPAVTAIESEPSAAMSADLRWAVYATPAGLLLHDRTTGITSLISEGSSPSVSDDGRRILFRRPPQPRTTPTERAQVFVYDHRSGAIDPVDVGAAILDEGRWAVAAARISGDGRYALFEAQCVDCGEGEGGRRIFIRNLDWQRTWELVRGVDGTSPNHTGVALRDVTPDARFVVFESGSSNLVLDDPLFSDLFAIDRITRRIVRLNADHRGGSTSLQASVSADGLEVAFGALPLFPRFPGAGPTATPPIFLSSLDVDGDRMQDDWESFVGLSPVDPHDGAEDWNRDGVTNLEEFRLGSQPKARFRFRSRTANVDPERRRIVLRNRGQTEAAVWLRLVDAAGLSSIYPVRVGPRSTLILPVSDIPDRPQGPFMLHVTSDVLVYPGLS